EQLRGLLSIVKCRMGFTIVKLHPGRFAGFGENSLTISQAAERCRIKSSKRMERDSFEFTTFAGSHDKTMVKRRVVSNDDGAAAIGSFLLFAYLFINLFQCVVFGNRTA